MKLRNIGPATSQPTTARFDRTPVLTARCILHTALLMSVVLCPVSFSARAQDARPPTVTLFSNVRIFDGKNLHLSPPSNVLVRGNRIEKISTEPIPVDRRADTTLIDGNGHTLMPGLIDAHWHVLSLEVNSVTYHAPVGRKGIRLSTMRSGRKKYKDAWKQLL